MRDIMLLFVLLFSFFSSSYGKEKTNRFIYEKNLSQHFYYFDLLDHTMLPYVNSERTKKVLYVSLDHEELENKKIVFIPVDDMSLYMNGHLINEFSAGSNVVIDFDSLGRQVNKEHEFAFYSEKGAQFLGSGWVVSESQDRFGKKALIYNDGIYRLMIENKSSIYLVLLIALVVLASMRYVQSPYIMAYFDVTKYGTRLGVEDFIYLNPFTGQSIVLMFLVSLVYAVSLVNVNVNYGWFETINVFKLLLFGVGILLGIFLKYAFLFLVNLLFGDIKVYKIHFFEFIRFFSLFSVLFFVFSIQTNVLFSIGLALVYLVWNLWLLFELVQKSKYRKMYLISYLCISEIFPVFVLVKQMGEW
jgi:hypothetical protein